jgi:hypothetical protein
MIHLSSILEALATANPANSAIAALTFNSSLTALVARDGRPDSRGITQPLIFAVFTRAFYSARKRQQRYQRLAEITTYAEYVAGCLNTDFQSRLEAFANMKQNRPSTNANRTQPGITATSDGFWSLCIQPVWMLPRALWTLSE